MTDKVRFSFSGNVRKLLFQNLEECQWRYNAYGVLNLHNKISSRNFVMGIQHGIEQEFQLADAKCIKKSCEEQRQKIGSLKCHLQGAWLLSNANSHIKYAGMWFFQVWMGRGNWFTNSDWNRNLRPRQKTKQLSGLLYGVYASCSRLFLWELLWLLCYYNVIKVLNSVIKY